jgi:gas vesicle protein GvpL/GvpF
MRRSRVSAHYVIVFMALLLYCVADSFAQLNSQSGVAGSIVSESDYTGVKVFYSESSASDVWLRAPLRTSGRQFHSVQQELFRAGAIIPFRFPTILENSDKLREHLDLRSTEYKSLLRRFANQVQMDLALTHATAPPASLSGGDYLRERQTRHRLLHDFAADLHAQATPLAKDWRQRSLSNGLRCFALVERDQVQQFNAKMKMVYAPAELSVRISGPWPVAEFLDFST